MTAKTSTCVLLAAALIAFSASADIHVRFVEGAPKDRFEIVNQSSCAVVATEVVIDLGSSAAGLVFDVTGNGAGVEVFQPFEFESGADALVRRPVVSDGDRQVVLSIRRLSPAARISFTIDVDDTLGPRGITVSGSEIEGATVRVESGQRKAIGRFSSEGRAAVTMPACM